MIKPTFSVIIPVRNRNSYLVETEKYLSKQSFSDYELLVITDEISKSPNPAFKRNLGAKMAKGKYLAFIDDDSYPAKNWLESVFKIFEPDQNLAAVCGPNLTPPNDDNRRQSTGLILSSFLGSGGAGSFRNRISPPRYVDDFPSVNLIVKKSDFIKIGGFSTHHWPGEDTVLCLDLTHKLRKKILYHPSVIVYHHRRQVFLPYLKQISRYALHRGHFARIFPKTSLRIGYLIPSLFTIYTLSIPFINNQYKYFPLYVYLSLALITLIGFLLKTKNLYISLMAILTIPLSHFLYGILFIAGYFSPNLKFTPHKTDKFGNYVGG